MQWVKRCIHVVCNRYFSPSADRFTTSTTTVVFFVYQSYWNRNNCQTTVFLLHFAERITIVPYVGKEAPALLTMQSLLHCICGPYTEHSR